MLNRILFFVVLAVASLYVNAYKDCIKVQSAPMSEEWVSQLILIPCHSTVPTLKSIKSQFPSTVLSYGKFERFLRG